MQRLKGKKPRPARITQFNLVKTLASNGSLSYYALASVKKRQFSYTFRSLADERTRKPRSVTKLLKQKNPLNGRSRPFTWPVSFTLDTAVHVINDQCQIDPYKNSNLSATTKLACKTRITARNELKLFPRVRAWDALSVKHSLMNDRYLLVRRGQKLDEAHNGTKRVAVALC